MPPKELSKEKNIFSVDADGTPILWDYQVRGFMKSACSACAKVNNVQSSMQVRTIR